MAKTKDFADASAHSGPVQVPDRKTEAPEKKAQPLRTPARLHSALPPPDGLPSVTRAVNLMRATAPPTGAPRCARMMQGMQQTAGNSRVNRMLGEVIQPKLTVSTPGDAYEREADEMANHVMRMPVEPDPHRRPQPSRGPKQRIQRACSCTDHGGQQCPECAKKKHQDGTVHRQAENAGQPLLTPDVESRIHRLRGGGQALSPAVRREFEPRFGEDFGSVRVHAGPEAAQVSREINARAFTIGRDVMFGAGEYAPETTKGQKLLAHELTHVVQQGGGSGTSKVAKMDRPERQKHAISPVDSDSVQRQPPPSNSPAPAPGVNPPPPPPPGGGAPAGTPATPPAGPEIRQGPIGDVVIPIGDWTFFDARDIVKPWSGKIDETSLLKIPIPELGVVVDLRGSAGATANFTASVGPGVLRNIRIGVTSDQYDWDVWPDDALFGVIGPAASLWTLKFDLDEFRGLADLDIRAHVGVVLGANAELKAAAEALGLFDVATLAAGLSATASAGLDLTFGGPIGIYWDNGHFHFRFDQSLDADLGLTFALNAYIQATLLGFSWTKNWILAQLAKNWHVGAPLNLSYNDDPNVDLPIAEADLQILPLLTDLLTAATPQQNLTPLAGSPSGTGGTARRGRTSSDPIDMIWYKSPGLYPISINLNGERHFFTEPTPVQVPDEPGLADIRRDANSSGQITIGVNPGSRFYPRIRSVWPRVRAGALRSGIKQAQFRRLLSALGYGWGSQQADHVRDLQWAGDDAYANLWPLEAAQNNAANRVLQQIVTYQDDSGQVLSVPLENTPLNRYFRIVGYN